MKDDAAEIFTLDEMAAYLKVGKRTVNHLEAEGKLPAFKLGGTWCLLRGDLDKWISSRIGKAMVDYGEGAE